jgi:hypothetical protein
VPSPQVDRGAVADLAPVDTSLEFFGQLEEAEQHRDVHLGAADAGGDLGLGEAEVAHACEREGFFDGGEVAAVDVLGERDVCGLLVGELEEVDGHFV